MSNRANNWAWELKLKPVQKSVLIALADHVRDETDLEWNIPLREICKWTCLSERSVCYALDQLQRKRLIRRTRSKGKYWSTYKILMDELCTTCRVEPIELCTTCRVNSAPHAESTLHHMQSLLLNPKQNHLNIHARTTTRGNRNGNGTGPPPIPRTPPSVANRTQHHDGMTGLQPNENGRIRRLNESDGTSPRRPLPPSGTVHLCNMCVEAHEWINPEDDDFSYVLACPELRERLHKKKRVTK